MEVKLHSLKEIENAELFTVVCVSKYKDKWVFAKNLKRGGWEIPGGHIEIGEDWLTAAKREMYEETGAIQVNIKPICGFSISRTSMLCYAEILSMDKLPEFEISEIGFFDDIPENLSFPDAHSLFFNTVKQQIEQK